MSPKLLIAFPFLLLSFQSQSQVVSKLDTITETKVIPFSNICQQQITRKKFLGKKSTFLSTGFLIRPNIILTAGHNVYSNSLSKVVKIKVYPGKNNDNTAYDAIEIKGESLCQLAIRVHPSYNFTKNDRIKWDFAVIIIPDSIIQRISNWPSSSAFSFDINHRLKENDSIFVAGFPASGGYSGEIMTYQSGLSGQLSTNKFTHGFDTHTGNSGSPVWIEKDMKRIVVGVHTFAGAATLLEENNLNYVLQWLSLHL